MRAAILVCTYGSDEWRDRGRQAAEKAEAQGALLTVALHDPEGTVSSVRNVAAHGAEGMEWLCFLDADDELASGYLSAMELALAKHKTGGSITDVKTESGPRPYRDLVSPALLVPNVQYVRAEAEEESRCLNTGRPLYEINWAVVGTLVPRDLFLKAGGFPEEPIYEDWAAFLRLHYDFGAQLVSVPDAVYRYFVSPDARNGQPDESEVYWRYRRLYEGRATP